MDAIAAIRVAQGYVRMSLLNFALFLGLSLVFGGWTVVSADVYETLPYADLRKVMAIGYAIPGVAFLLSGLHLCGRTNATLRFGAMLARSAPGDREDGWESAFRSLNPLWLLIFYPAVLIAVTYVILIYAVDGGLF